ncbi:MAG: restriction endonuclease subunit S [Bacteroidales bacterium]|nr:restriction endonuclease subunit S [Bacteroidales bacterium]
MNDITIDKTGWKKYRFGDVAIQTKEIVDMDNTELTRYVAGEHMNSEDIHIRRWGTVGDGYLGPAFIRRFHKGDILYGSRRTYLKKVAIADFDGITANTTFVIKPKEELIEPVLLVHLMLSKSFTEYSVTNSRGSVNPYINWKDIADYEFLLPPKPEQKRLAALLWAADEMLEKEERVLEKVEMYRTSVCDDFFKTIESSKPIKSFGNIFTGSTPSTKISEFWNGEYSFLTPTEINNTLEPQTASRFVTSEGLKASREISKGDVLVTCVGEIGRITIASQKCCANQQINIISPNNTIDSKYLFYCLKQYKNLLLKATTISVVPILVKSSFENIQIPDFQTNKKESFVKWMDVIEQQIEQYSILLEQSRQIKQELINKVF